jgi:hypothetical protein
VTRAAALAAALLLLLPAAAGAQDTGARTPAVGGGSVDAAPLLEPGRYRDTILPDEFLYYGVRLAVGQRLHIRARIASTDAEAWSEATRGFAINLSTPLRERLVDPVAEDVLGNGNAELGPVTEANMGGRLRWDFYGPPALPLPEALEEFDYQGPGTWYLSFNLFTRGERQQVEFPIEFDLELDGVAQDEPPDPTPEPTATPTPSGEDEPAAGDDGGGPALGAVAALGAAGVAAGLVIGGLLGRRRRT